MRNLDSVLFEIGRESSTGVTIQPLSSRTLAAAGERAAFELRLIALAIIKLTVVLAMIGGLTWLCRRLYAWGPVAEYTAVAVVPLFAALLAAMLTTTVRLCVEPRRVSAPTLLLGALCAYPAAWLIRALVVDAGWPSLEWMIASKAGDLGALSGWAPHAMAAEMTLTVVLGLCWARWFLGPQRQ